MLPNALLRYIRYTHAQTCDCVPVQSATQGAASLHTLHKPISCDNVPVQSAQQCTASVHTQYFTHAQACDNVRVQSATQCTVSVNIILDTCPNLLFVCFFGANFRVSSTTLYYKCATPVLQSTTPVLLCTTKYYSWLILDVWNVIYNARSNKSHPPTSPNTAPGTQNESHDWFASHMKRHLHCAEQQESSSNFTKYCPCQAKWISWLIRITYGTSITMRGATRVILQLHQILRLPRKMNLMIDPHHIWKVIYNARSTTTTTTTTTTSTTTSSSTTTTTTTTTRDPTFHIRDSRSEIRDPRFEIRDPNPRFEIRDSRSEIWDSSSEIRDRDSRSEIRDSRSEIRDSTSDIRGPRFEIRDSRFEIRDYTTVRVTIVTFDLKYIYVYSIYIYRERERGILAKHHVITAVVTATGWGDIPKYICLSSPAPITSLRILRTPTSAQQTSHKQYQKCYDMANMMNKKCKLPFSCDPLSVPTVDHSP